VKSMKTSLRLIASVVLVVLLSILTLPAADTSTVADLTGQWHGKSRFTGINYDEAKQKQITPLVVNIALQISSDGTVTGQVGGAKLSGSVSAVNRGFFGRLFRLKTNFVIEGKVVGAVAMGSEDGTHLVKLPFTFADQHIGGSLFATYTIKYPYPFLNIQLNR